jgi:DNA-binding CsgD family transcriptional regulator
MSDHYKEYIQLISDKLKRDGDLSIYDADLCLTTRLKNSLKNMGLTTINSLLDRTESDLLSYPTLGRKSLNEVKELLHDLGLCLKGASSFQFSGSNISVFERNVRLQHLLKERDRIDTEIKRLQALSVETEQPKPEGKDDLEEIIQKDIESLAGGNKHLAKLILVGGLTNKQAIALRERVAKKTYKEIGELMGFSAHYARDLVIKAMKKLNHPTRRLKLQPELFALGLWER